MAWNPFDAYGGLANPKLLAKRDDSLRRANNPSQTGEQKLEGGMFSLIAGGAAYLSKHAFEKANLGRFAAGSVKVISSVPGAAAIAAGYFLLTRYLDTSNNKLKADLELNGENATLKERTGVDFGHGPVTMDDVARIQATRDAGRSAAQGPAAQRVAAEPRSSELAP